MAARAVQQLHREEYYRRVAVLKPLITKMNANLRVHLFKTHRHWSTTVDKRGRVHVNRIGLAA